MMRMRSDKKAFLFKSRFFLHLLTCFWQYLRVLGPSDRPSIHFKLGKKISLRPAMPFKRKTLLCKSPTTWIEAFHWPKTVRKKKNSEHLKLATLDTTRGKEKNEAKQHIFQDHNLFCLSFEGVSIYEILSFSLGVDLICDAHGIVEQLSTQQYVIGWVNERRDERAW